MTENADQVTCPHCNKTMTPGVVERGPTAGRQKCSLCGRGFGAMPEIEPQETEQGETEMASPQKPEPVPDVPDVTMPEQRRLEPEIAPPPTVEIDQVAPRSDPNRPWTQREHDEYQIRIRVKRQGGFIKGLGIEGQKRARALMAKYNRKPEDGWDKSVDLVRFDNASHETNQRALYEKPVKMIRVDK